jgi:uncharacterized protein YegP (UPF0339 family)
MTRLKVYRDRRGEWRWTLFARNGKKLANSGEGYKRRAYCSGIARRLFPWFIEAPK